MISDIEEYFKNRKLNIIQDYNKYIKLNKNLENFNGEVDYHNVKSLSELLLNELNIKNFSNIPLDYLIKFDSELNIKFEEFSTKIFHSDVKLNRNNNQKDPGEYFNRYDLNWDYCYITGGQISKFLRNSDDKGYEESDVDILVSLDSKDEVKFRKIIMEFVKDKEYEIKKYRERFVVKISGVKDQSRGLVERSKIVKYDFILVLKKDLITFVLNFHLSCVKGIYNKNIGLLVSPICKISNDMMINLTIISDRIYINISVLKKYLNRGYSFMLNEYEYKIFSELIFIH